MEQEIKYLGFIINAAGRRPDPKKVQAIVDMPPPKDVEELRAFLGMLTFYAAFIPKMKGLEAPLVELLKRGVEFTSSSECEAVFVRAKEILLSDLLPMPSCTHSVELRRPRLKILAAITDARRDTHASVRLECVSMIMTTGPAFHKKVRRSHFS